MRAIHRAPGEAPSPETEDRIETNGWVRLEALAQVTNPDEQIKDFQRANGQNVMVASSSRGPNSDAIQRIDRASAIINNPWIPDAGGWKGPTNMGLGIGRGAAGGWGQ